MRTGAVMPASGQRYLKLEILSRDPHTLSSNTSSVGNPHYVSYNPGKQAKVANYHGNRLHPPEDLPSSLPFSAVVVLFPDV